MAKVIVVSDSHGLTAPLYAIYNAFKGQASHFIHCGDSELNINHELFAIYQSVKGNCDDDSFEYAKLIQVNNKKILFTHGHHHHVKWSLNRLCYYGSEQQADIVCFGHSHQPLHEEMEGIHLVNPGSIRHNRVWGLKKQTFAVIEIIENQISVKHLDVDTFKEISIK